MDVKELKSLLKALPDDAKISILSNSCVYGIYNNEKPYEVYYDEEIKALVFEIEIG